MGSAMSTDRREQYHGHSHGHGVSADADSRRLGAALALIVGFMIVEVVVGIFVHSLALLSDAAHMLTDAGALAMSLVVIRLVQRPAGGNLTFGLKRTEILSAQANGATLLVLAALIVYEGIRRLITPPQPGGLAILVVALVGIGVNLLATWQLAKANRESMNIEGSFQHILTDLFAFIATAIAGAAILFTGFERADGIASLLIAAIMLKAAYGLLRDSGRVLLEAAPEGMSVKEIGVAIAAHPHVENVHDLHVWEVSSGFPALSAHVLVRPGDDCHAVRRALEQMLGERFGARPHHAAGRPPQRERRLCHAPDIAALTGAGRPSRSRGRSFYGWTESAAPRRLREGCRRAPTRPGKRDWPSDAVSGLIVLIAVAPRRRRRARRLLPRPRHEARELVAGPPSRRRRPGPSTRTSPPARTSSCSSRCAQCHGLAGHGRRLARRARADEGRPGR